MENKPFLSIIIPMYNDEKYIGLCLESVFRQSFGDVEVIVIDDGSSDRSADICKKYMGQHQNLKLLTQSNSGSSTARNNGIKCASGQYLMFLDSDDFLTSADALKTLAGSLKKTNADVLVYLPREYDESATDILINYPKGKWQENKAYSTETVCNSLYSENGIWVTQAPTKIVSSELIRENKIRFSEGIYHEDDEWVANVFLHSKTIVFLYQPYYGRRRRENSKSNTADPEKAYKRTCDRIFVGSQMIMHPLAKKYKEYLAFVSEYFFNTMLRASKMDEEKRQEFIRYLSQFKPAVRRAVSIKTPKQSMKALYILIFGIENYIKHYERTSE